MAEANLDTVELTGNKPAPQTQTTDPAPAPQPEPAEPVEPVEPAAVELAPDPPPAAEGDDPPGHDQEPKPHAQTPFQKRIDRLMGERNSLARDKAALELKVAQYEQQQTPKPAEPSEVPQVPRPAAQIPDVDTLVNQRAQALYQQRVQEERASAVVAAGQKEFSDFNDRTETVWNLGAADRPDFKEIITDPSIVPDGHKVIASLADNPDEAARILSLPTVAMSAELARYAERVAKPTAAKTPAISKAPTPIRPLNGSAVASDEPSSNDSEDDWFAKREAQRAQRQKGARF